MNRDELLMLHRQLCGDARLLMEDKLSNSSGFDDPFSNFTASTSLNVDPSLGILVRIQDRLLMISNFLKNGEFSIANKSLIDCHIDLINYTVLNYGLLRDRSLLFITHGNTVHNHSPTEVHDPPQGSNSPGDLP